MMTLDERRAHDFRNLQKHPKKCPRCQRPWEGESAANHKCVYCKHKLRFETIRHEASTPLWQMFVPIILWVCVGLVVLWYIGRK